MLTEYKNLYISTYKKYPMEPATLARLHCVSCGKVEKWLDAKSEDSPDFSAIYELYMLIKRLDLQMPACLLKSIQRSQNRVVELIESLSENPITKEKIIKQKRTRLNKAVYYFKGQALYVRQIQKALGLNISRSTIIARINRAGLKVGDSIDSVDFSRNRPIYKRKDSIS